MQQPVNDNMEIKVSNNKEHNPRDIRAMKATEAGHVTKSIQVDYEMVTLIGADK